MSVSKDVYWATIGFRVRHRDGTIGNYVMDTKSPIEEVLEIQHVPFCAKDDNLFVTSGPMQFYKARLCMVPDECFKGDDDITDDSSMKNNNNLSVPVAGEILGYIRFSPLYYLGNTKPLSGGGDGLNNDTVVCLFRLSGESYTTMNATLRLLFDCDLITMSPNYVRKILCEHELSFKVRYVTGYAPANEMMEKLKALSEVSQRANSLYFIATKTLDEFVAKNGVNIHFNWSLV